jgi:hypothetical protein
LHLAKSALFKQANVSLRFPDYFLLVGDLVYGLLVEHALVFHESIGTWELRS